MGSKLALGLRVWASLGNGGLSHKVYKTRCLHFIPQLKGRHKPTLAKGIIGLVLKKMIGIKDAASPTLVLGIDHTDGRPDEGWRIDWNG